jgi:hypothetical protein
MVIGANYAFRFTCGLLGSSVGCPALADVADAVRTDSNFSNPVAGFSGSGTIVVSFTYAGRGSNILNAALEMAQVIQSNVSGYARFVFVSAEGPTATGNTQQAGNNAQGGNDSSGQDSSNSGGSGLSYPGAPDGSQAPQGTSWSTYALAGVGIVLGAKVIMGFFQ